MKFVEARGHRRTPKRELHHLEIHAHPDGTPQEPRWLVVHDFGSDHEPDVHDFTDHEEMLAHVRTHSSTEPVEEDRGSPRQRALWNR